MHNIQLIYSSRAAKSVGYSELSQILSQAAAFNAANAVSGMLCYGDGAFLQVLEGARETVNRIYGRIVRDARNSDNEILSYAPTSVRTFQDWSMKMVSLDEHFAPKRRAMLKRYASGDAFEPHRFSARRAHDFLLELAQEERARSSNADSPTLHRAGIAPAPLD